MPGGSSIYNMEVIIWQTYSQRVNSLALGGFDQILGEWFSK